MREIHVSGPRLDQGVLRDRHLELQEKDYSLLAWLLERTEPQVVTLEYGGTFPDDQTTLRNDPAALARQVERLAKMVGEA